MWALAAICVGELILLAVFAQKVADARELHAQGEARLWQHIDLLEGDKRALTESLCRAQGKAYIQPRESKELIPSPGWFDGKPEIKVVNQ